MYQKFVRAPRFFLFSNERKRDSSDAILRFILFAMVRDKFLREKILNAPRAIKLEHKLNDPIWKRNWFLICVHIWKDKKIWCHFITNNFNVLFLSFNNDSEISNEIHNQNRIRWWMFCKALQIFPILNEDTYAKVQLRWKWRHQRRADNKSSSCSLLPQ